MAGKRCSLHADSINWCDLSQHIQVFFKPPDRSLVVSFAMAEVVVVITNFMPEVSNSFNDFPVFFFIPFHDPEKVSAMYAQFVLKFSNPEGIGITGLHIVA